MTDETRALLLQHGPAVARQFLELVQQIDREDPTPDDVRALRAMLEGHPQLWRVAGDLAYAAVLNIVAKLDAGPLVTESLKHSWVAMKDELGYPSASPLERLLMEQVVLCWLHLHIVELECTTVMNEPIPAASADHWERRLSAAQRRYLRACETLARIRKLARTTPALQVNIATHGGQQVNLLDADHGVCSLLGADPTPSPSLRRGGELLSPLPSQPVPARGGRGRGLGRQDSSPRNPNAP
jgi:hypothetical protein